MLTNLKLSALVVCWSIFSLPVIGHAQSAAPTPSEPTPATGEPTVPAPAATAAEPSGEAEPPGAEQPAPPVQPSPPEQATQPAQPEGPTAPEAPQKLAVGKQGTFQPSLLLQAWWQLVDNANTTTSFRIRRAELKLKGSIIPELVDYALMLDAAKTLKFGTQTVPVQNQDPVATDPLKPEQVQVLQAPTDSSILQDFYITFLSTYTNVSIGQFKLPLSWEGYNSSSQLLIPERALVSRTYGDRRDLGVRAEKNFDKFGYLLTLTNGTGVNRLDDNNDKDVALRVEVKPVSSLLVAAAGSATVGSRKEPSTKDRAEVDIRGEMGDFLAQAEYLHAWDGIDATRREGHGAYAALAYLFLERIQPVVRVGFLDPDVETSKNSLVHYEVGANYLLQKNELKLQASYSVFDAQAAAVKTERQFTLNAQAQF